MNLAKQLLNFFPIVGSTVRETHQTARDINDLRVVRVDDNGFLLLSTGPTGPIYGVAGDDTALNPFRQVLFVPQVGAFRSSVTAVVQEIGPLVVDKTYHITSSVDAWALVGPTGGVAVVGDAVGGGTTHLKGGATYEYIAKAGSLYLQFLRDPSVADGYIAVSRVET